MACYENRPLVEVAAIQYAEVERHVAECERAYSAGSRVHCFWWLADLKGSASYRLLAGDRPAFIRGEVFSSTLGRLSAQYGAVDVFKEMGDAVLARSDSLRPILEIVCMARLIERLWRAGRPDQGGMQLTARTAVTFGPATRLRRETVVDFVGQPLDRLARVASQEQSPDVLCVIDDAAYQQDSQLLRQEFPFVSVAGPYLVSKEKLKAGESPVRYWELRTDDTEMGEYRDFFEPLRHLD